jgi:hypothetical protein
VAGYDTGSTVSSVWRAAKSDYGTPLFWIRYFSPSPVDVVNASASNAVAECQAIWSCNSGSPCLGPVTSPGDLTGNSAAGQADAKTFCAALNFVYTNVAPLLLPTNGQLYCWLDQECSASMSSGYWDGWATYVNGYNGLSGGSYPLYACLYCSPCCTPHNCSSICAGCDGDTCYAVWTPEYQKCGYNLNNTPPSDFATCNGCGVDNGIPTRVWQFAEQTVCGLSVNVDMDVGTPGFGTGDYCFYLASNP